MTARILCKYGRMKGQEFVLSKDEPVLIGRSHNNLVMLNSSRISALHARIFWEPANACYKLEDLGSTNGTYIDGTPVKEAEVLGYLHLLNFGGVLDFFYIDSERVPLCAGGRLATPEIALSHQTMMGAALTPLHVQTPAIFATKGESELRRTLVGVPLPALPANLAARVQPVKKKRVYLVLSHLDREWAFALAEGDNILGRSKGLPLRLDHDDISRRHALLSMKDGKIYLEDLKSTNLSYIDGRAVNERTLIPPGAQLAFGQVKGFLEEREEGVVDG